MNRFTQERLGIARTVADHFSQIPSVVAVGVCGSVARGTADVDSDLDIYVFWERPESEVFGVPPLLRYGAERFFFSGLDSHGDCLEQYYFGGVKVDLAHQQIQLQEEIFRQVLERHEISPDLFKFMAAIADLTPLWGDDEISGMVRRANSYPVELRTKAIIQFMNFGPISLLALCLRRDDRLGFYSYLVRSAANAASVVAALNGKFFHPSAELKGVFPMLQNLPQHPPRLFDSYQELLSNPTEGGLSRLGEDLFSLLDLAEEIVPLANILNSKRTLDFKFRLESSI